MKYPWLFVGAKVVCVDDGAYENAVTRGAAPSLTKGAIYTVTEIRPARRDPSVVVIALAEIPNPPLGIAFIDAMPWTFRASRFRPVSTVNTDATVAALKQAMLDHVANASGGLGIRKPVRV